MSTDASEHKVLITVHMPMDAMKFSGILFHMSKAFPECYLHRQEQTGFTEICERKEK